MPRYTAPAPLESQSGLERLPMKMFSCVNASLTLVGSNAGGNAALVGIPTPTEFHNWPGYSELSIYFKTQRKLKCNWLKSIVLLNSVNNTMYPN